MGKNIQFRKQLHRRILDSGDQTLITAEITLKRLLLVWSAVRLAAAVVFLLAIRDYTQVVTAVVTLVFAYLLMNFRPLAALACAGGLLTVFQVFHLQYFQIASAYNSSLLFFFAILLLAVGVVQTLIMGYIMLSKKLKRYYELVRRTRMDLKGQLAESAKQRRDKGEQ